MNSIRQIRVKAGLKQAEVIRDSGLDKSSVYRYEKGDIPLFNEGAIAIFGAMGYRTEDEILGALSGSVAPLIGYVGAGAVVIPVEDDREVVDTPPGLIEPFAVRVRGTSMVPAYRDGDVLICDVQPVTSREILNKDCVVLTIDGRRLVKKVLPGAGSAVQLLSYETQEAEQNVYLQSAAIVRWVKRG
ncbi:S24 family peptidase [Roseococcus pinisoli]|uniref:LexA family transcriptional regulator n=1 Tax=Roseococcus pinisoli TaxID=2835040 RepID=A0ABS5Q9X6_9PROT|nr:S24 family peptidase [Roseococcus pinisoli]MBS7810514.1 LexA family transcriptional regulator [Roseococcus pinisoli]